MATEKEAAASAAATTTGESASLLDQAIAATKQTEKSRAEQLIKTLVDEAMAGTVTWNKSVTRTIAQAIDKIDEKISRQLAEIMHAEAFQKLEGSWRGLHHLVMNSETGTTLKLRVMNVSKKDLFKDLDTAVEFDQSQMFKKIYESEFGTAGGEPYGALIGDYEFSNHPDDIELLNKISGVCGAAHCPFLSAASPKMMGLEDFTELNKPRDLAKIFDSVEYAKWNSFRESEDARYVTLVMPRVLARLPYGKATKPVEEFNYEEVALGPGGKAKEVPHDQYCWMNAAYIMGTKMTEAFAKYGWCTAIRGAEGGGKVEGLPSHVFTSEDGDMDQKCPTEVNITDRREAELSKLGFLPLCHYKNQDYAVFFGAQTTQKPKKYDRAAATANAAISARLPYIMAVSRFSHYLKVMARDWLGSFMEVNECQDRLNRWIANYVLKDDKPSQEMKARYPLADAKVEVVEVPGSPGSYNAVAWLRPWLQLEELTTSMRLVARIPQKQG